MGNGVLTLDVVCTHDISRRLLPTLPRCSLRALAGHFGRAVGALRRSADHIGATALVWHELIRLLETKGVSTWLYYTPPHEHAARIMKTRVTGGPPIEVRNDNALAPAVAPDGTLLYYAAMTNPGVGFSHCEIRVAQPEDGPSRVLARISGRQIPVSATLIHMFLSPDGASLAMPLTDGASTNLWILPTDGGPLRQVTDFLGRSTMIARRIAWAPDSHSLYAAVEESIADVVSLEGLVE